jgi:hypothetical protein
MTHFDFLFGKDVYLILVNVWCASMIDSKPMKLLFVLVYSFLYFTAIY